MTFTCPAFQEPLDCQLSMLFLQLISSMKLNPDYHTLSQKSMQSEIIEAAAGVVVEDAGVDRTEEIVVQEIRQHLRLPAPQDIVGPSILICHQGNGQDAPCISNTGKVLFSAQNLRRVHGRMFLLQDQPNETLTSLVNQTQLQ